MEKGKANVVFLALNAKYVHSSLSVWYLAAGLRQNAPQLCANIIEATTREQNDAIINKILAHGPFAVCFSCYIWNIKKALEIAAQVKALHPQIVIIFGGPEAEHQAENLLLKYSFISYISHGEGEESLPALLSAVFVNKTHFNDKSYIYPLHGVSYVENNTFCMQSPVPLSAPPPSPYTAEYLTALNTRMAYIESSRGCPYSCAFCLSGACGKPRWFALSEAFNNIVTLANSGAQTVKFIDRTFNANAAHANAIWKFITENYGGKIPHGVRFHFEIAADILTEESLEILKALPRGAVQLEAGIQSVNEKTLATVRRKTNTEKLLKALQRLISFDNMHVHIDLIAGLPHEGLESFEKGFNCVYPLKANMLQLGFLKLLHGSAMRQSPSEYPCEFEKEPPYEVISTPWLSEAELSIISIVEDALERLYNSGRFLLTLEYMLTATQYTPFKLFSSVPKAAAKTDLSEYTSTVLQAFKVLPNVDEMRLRDVMAEDWLCFNSTGRLPTALAIADKALKQAVKDLAKTEEHAPKSGTKRGVALLYSENAAIYVDYQNQDVITGRFTAKRVQLEK